MLGMQAMQLLTTAEACHYLLAARKEEPMVGFEDPVFFGFINASVLLRQSPFLGLKNEQPTQNW